MSAYIKRQLGLEKRAFGSVASDSRAKTLSSSGKNVIDVEGDRERATAAQQALEVYDQCMTDWARGADRSMKYSTAQPRNDPVPDQPNRPKSTNAPTKTSEKLYPTLSEDAKSRVLSEFRKTQIEEAARKLPAARI